MDKGCGSCKNLEEHYDDRSDGFSQESDFICAVRAKVQNLKQFPFKTTKCEHHSALEQGE